MKSIALIVLILMAHPAFANNSFEQFLDGESGVAQNPSSSQEETNRQLLVLQKAMIDNLKKETQVHRTQLENMHAEIDALNKKIESLKQNPTNQTVSGQQRQIDELRSRQEKQANDSIFREMDANHSADEAEIMHEWEHRSIKNQIERDMQDTTHQKAFD